MSRVSPDDQNVTFVELFFDLVFVFSVTQIVSLFHHHMDWGTVGRAVLVFWLVWWGWTQFTWALNAADTNHGGVRLWTLVATGIAFFMAVTIPDAFGERALGFAVFYVAVRSVGLWVYAWVACADPSQTAAVRRFTVASIFGLIAVLAGAWLGGTLQLVCWAAAIGLDVVAALIGGQEEGWNLHPDHFAERHGLFVIIALGEGLIVAASGLVGEDWDPNRLTVGILAVATTCALWWIHFHRAKPMLDHAFETTPPGRRSRMGRDVYSLFHFPILCGIVAIAVALEHALSHPSEPLPRSTAMALVLATVLYGGGMVMATLRATGRLLKTRLILGTAVVAFYLLVPDLSPAVGLGVLFVAAVLIGVAERGHVPDEGAPIASPD